MIFVAYVKCDHEIEVALIVSTIEEKPENMEGNLTNLLKMSSIDV